jgi:hypothetical protein
VCRLELVIGEKNELTLPPFEPPSADINRKQS